MTERKPPNLVALRGGEGTGSGDTRMAKVYELAAQLAESLEVDEHVTDVMIIVSTSKNAVFHGADYGDINRMSGALVAATARHHARIVGRD